MKSKKQIKKRTLKYKKNKKRTRKYKKNKTLKIKGGKLIYKNDKWVAEVNHNAIQNDNVRLYREAEARMMNLLKIPNDGRKLTDVLSNIPYMTFQFNAVDYYIQRRIISNLEDAIKYREKMNYQDDGHLGFLVILTTLHEVLYGIFQEKLPPVGVEEPPWRIDELQDMITNLKEQRDFFTNEIEKGESPELQLYLDKLEEINKQLETLTTEIDGIQAPGAEQPPLPIAPSANPYEILAGEDDEPTLHESLFVEPGLPESNPIRKPDRAAAAAEEPVPIPHASSYVEEQHIIVQNAIIPKLPNKLIEPRDRYVHFLTKYDYEQCIKLLESNPDYIKLLTRLYEKTSSSGKIIPEKKYDDYIKAQNTIFYAVIHSYINNAMYDTRKINNNFYWLLYLINAFKNVYPSCQLSNENFLKFSDESIQQFLKKLYNWICIIVSFLSKNMLSLINSNRFIQTPFNTYVYLFETFNILFTYYTTDDEISLIKRVLIKCISNIQERRQFRFEKFTFYPDTSRPIFIFDTSILQTPPLFHDIMNEKGRLTLSKIKDLLKTEHNDENRNMFCNARNEIIDDYLKTLLETSTKEINELLTRKENNTVFIKKIILIFYNLMYTSVPYDDYVFKQENMVDIIANQFKLSITKFLTQLKKAIETGTFTTVIEQNDIYLTYNQLYSFIAIYFYPIRPIVYDDTFNITTNYIFENDL